MRENITNENSPEEFVNSNPGLFKTGTTSRDEGYFYWALLRLIGEEGKPGKQGLTWFYQSKVAGGSTQAGGSVVDFIVSGATQGFDLGMRIVTKRFHNQAGPLKQAIDELQRSTLLDSDIFPIDVQSSDYIFDDTGAAVLRVAQDAIQMTPGRSPIYSVFGTP